MNSGSCVWWSPQHPLPLEPENEKSAASLVDNSINDSTKPGKTDLDVGLEGLEKEKPSFCKELYVPLHRGCIFSEADIVQAWGPGVKYDLCFMSKPGVTLTQLSVRPGQMQLLAKPLLLTAWNDSQPRTEGKVGSSFTINIWNPVPPTHMPPPELFWADRPQSEALRPEQLLGSGHR